jgi:hypothetical protein
MVATKIRQRSIGRTVRIASLVGAYLLGATAGALADQTIVLNVPVSLTTIPPAIQSIFVLCSIGARAGGASMSQGNSPLLPIKGGYSGSVSVPMEAIGDDQLTGLSSLAYTCRVAMLPKPPSAYPNLPAFYEQMTSAQLSTLLVQPATLVVNGTIPLVVPGPALRISSPNLH